MPSVNPYLDVHGQISTAGPVPQQGTLRSGFGMADLMNPLTGSATAVNAAGTSEPVALHVAVIVVMALVGVYVLRASGFKFVLAVSSSVGR